MRSIRPGCALLFVMLASFVPAVASSGADDGGLAIQDLARGTVAEARTDDWYVLEIGGAVAGWMHEKTSQTPERSTYERTSVIRIRRGATELEIKMAIEMEDAADGTPISALTRQDMGRQRVESTYEFAGEHVEMITRQGGQELTQSLALPAKPWLTPIQADRFFNAAVARGETTITYRLLDLENGLEPIETTYTKTGEEVAKVDGKSIPCTVWSVATDVMPGVQGTMRLDANGATIDEVVDLPFGRMVTRRSTEAEALAANEGRGPELMLSMFVELDEPLPLVARARTATYRLTLRAGEMPTLPSTGAQRVEAGAAPNTVTLRIDVDTPLPADDVATLEEYVSANPMVNSEDVMIGKLAERATRKAGENERARAEALRTFVHEYISAKSLDTAFASASETARTRTGDCSEHGVLLCALLRANRIPARVAIGLVYVDAFAGEENVFGWHMWTQALVDGAWIDLDATLPARYHAGHVLTATSSLAVGTPADPMNNLLQLIGNLDIEVVEVGYAEP